MCEREHLIEVGRLYNCTGIEFLYKRERVRELATVKLNEIRHILCEKETCIEILSEYEYRICTNCGRRG